MKIFALLTLLIYVPALVAQTGSISGAMAGMGLYINIIEGEDALNNIHDRAAREPIVQVTEKDHKQRKGAIVLFTVVPGAAGAGATFGSQLSYSTVTDEDGRAVGHGFATNSIAGAYTIQVTATFEGASATATIHERNRSKEDPMPIPMGGSSGVVGFFESFPGFLVATGVAEGAALGIMAIPGGDGGATVPTANTSTTTVPTPPLSVPEIDPSVAFGCLAMLAGAAAVLRGGRRR